MFKWIQWLFGGVNVDEVKQVKKYEWNEKALKALSKVALDKHAEEWGVKLDRRKRKADMLSDFRAKLEEKDLV